MKKSIIYLVTFVSMIMAISCHKQLDKFPINSTLSKDVYNTPEGLKQSLAKVYGAFALTGSTGSGSSDLAGIDAGTSDFLRLYWMAQELPTDEVICAWLNDPGISDLNNISWTSGNILMNGLYNRSVYHITVANAFLRETAGLNIDAENLKNYRAEARLLRAYQYWVLMDLFANPPFVDETSVIGKVAPNQIKRADLFKYIESELLAIEPDLKDAKSNEYGRADKAAAWALLARMYLNSEVYTGENHYTDAVTYSEKVINSNYSLQSDYASLFMADNNVNNNETILSINYDGNRSQNYGGTTFIVNGSIDGAMIPANYGVPGGGWGGIRARKQLPQKFGDDYTLSNDDRAKLFKGSTYDISNIATFGQGINVVKFTNMKSDGTAPENASTFVSTDFPIFRLAEQYLIYAEATLRGGAGNAAKALEYVNSIRSRANAAPANSINLNYILDERARELYWEGLRRTDLIRYNMFTTANYMWQWKGGIQDGRAVENKFRLYPIPAADIVANTNLDQNPGY